jgi:hypothetical protein
MKKGKNVMKNKKATNKNIQKKAMKDKKKKALARLKMPRTVDDVEALLEADKKKKALARLKMPRTVDDVEALLEADSKAQKLKKKAPRHLKDKKNLKRPAAGDPERKMKGPRTPILKGPCFPDVSVTAGEGYYKLFKLTCMIVPPQSSSSRKRIVVGASNFQAAGPLLVARGHVVGENFSQMLQRPRTSILKGPCMPDASLMPEEDYFKPFQVTCMVIPPNRLVVGVINSAYTVVDRLDIVGLNSVVNIEE